MTSVRVTSLFGFANDVLPRGLYRGGAGNDPRHDHGIVRFSIWTALHGVVGYAKHVVAQVLDTGNARNVGIGYGDRLDHRQVDVHFALSLPAQVGYPFQQGEYEANGKSAKLNIRDYAGAFAYLTYSKARRFRPAIREGRAMKLHLFPKALETAAPSDRGVVPLRVPVAPILVRYSVAASCDSQAGNDGWARVRYTSCGPSPLFRHLNIAGFCNFWRALRAWSFGILAQPAKQSRCRFTKCFEVLSAVFVHDEHNGRRMRQSAVKE
jgi:hypothetical protein